MRKPASKSIKKKPNRKGKVRISKPERELVLEFGRRGVEVIPSYRLWDDVNNRKSKWIYDIYLSEYNLLIEYNGSVWHKNPAQYKSGEIVTMPGSKKQFPVDRIWEKDRRKASFARSRGFKLLVLWDVYYLKFGTKVTVDTILRMYRKVDQSVPDVTHIEPPDKSINSSEEELDVIQTEDLGDDLESLIKVPERGW